MKSKAFIVLVMCAVGFLFANVPGALIGAGLAMYVVDRC